MSISKENLEAVEKIAAIDKTAASTLLLALIEKEGGVSDKLADTEEVVEKTANPDRSVRRIQRFLKTAEAELSQANSSFRKYSTGNRKYVPQLDNLLNSANQLRQMGRLIYAEVKDIQDADPYSR